MGRQNCSGTRSKGQEWTELETVGKVPNNQNYHTLIETTFKDIASHIADRISAFREQVN